MNKRLYIYSFYINYISKNIYLWRFHSPLNYCSKFKIFIQLPHFRVWQCVHIIHMCGLVYIYEFSRWSALHTCSSSDLNLGLSPKRKGEEEGLSVTTLKVGAVHLGKKSSNLHRVQPMRMVVLNFGCAILLWKCHVVGRWWPKLLGVIWAANMIRMLIKLTFQICKWSYLEKNFLKVLNNKDLLKINNKIWKVVVTSSWNHQKGDTHLQARLSINGHPNANVF